MRPHHLIAALFCCVLAAFPGCGERSTSPETSGPPIVVVSIPPLEGLVRPMLAPEAEIRVLVPAGRSAHGYQPSPEDIAALGKADAVLFVGLGLESGGMVRAARGRDVISMAGVLGMDTDDHSGHDHSVHDHAGHDHSHDHDHGQNDPHLWLDPVLAAQFVRALPDALPERLRTEASAERAETLAIEIDGVDAAYRERLAPFAGRAIVTHHASFGRAADRYGLRVAAVLRAVETLEPSPQEMAAAVRAVKERGVGAIFVEPQFGTTSATRVADSAGVELVTLDPLGGGDWPAMMLKNLDALVEGLSAGRADASGGAGGGEDSP